MKGIDNIFSVYDKSLKIASSRAQEFIQRHSQDINQVESLFADEASRYLYAQEISYCALSQILRQDLVPYFTGLMTDSEFKTYVDSMRSNRLFSLFAAPSTDDSDFYKAIDMTATFMLEQYSYKDIVRVEEGDICIDGGAFIGDTALYFTERKAKKIYAFEIDRENLKCLKTNITNFQKSESIEIVEKALGRHTSTMSYVPTQGNISAGQIREICDNQKGYNVDVITIDDFCMTVDCIPNFIKLDVEGSELDALNGSRAVIKKYRPKLAVCIYHTFEHRWEIPLLVHEICPDYRLYLKKSQPHGETVLFAIL